MTLPMEERHYRVERVYVALRLGRKRWMGVRWNPELIDPERVRSSMSKWLRRSMSRQGGAVVVGQDRRFSVGAYPAEGGCIAALETDAVRDVHADDVGVVSNWLESPRLWERGYPRTITVPVRRKLEVMVKPS